MRTLFGTAIITVTSLTSDPREGNYWAGHYATANGHGPEHERCMPRKGTLSPPRARHLR